ncbi:MAG: SDR family NAD(P)-dependent oxidoreductase [Rhizobiaceae bacterium]
MKRNILITGGTTGIGAALAQIYETDNTVFVTGSKPEGAIDDTQVTARYICADQNNPLVAAKTIVTSLEVSGVRHLDLVVLNAGIGFWREPDQESVKEIRATLDVNLSANIALSHHLFPFLEKAKGKLVLIGSTSHKGQAKLATYAASKAALDGFARALRSEWQGRVRVQIIHPGPTATPMHAKARLETGKAGALFASAKSSAKMIAAAINSNQLRTSLTIGRRIVSAVTSWARL